jgi:hyperosmotically inducible protein
MFRALLRLVVVLVILVGAAAFFLGWWGSNRLHPGEKPVARSTPAVGTSGKVDTEKAREVGAQVGAKTAEAANRAGVVLSEGALTAKIKSKMALDDLVQARSIDVSTSGRVVTVSGTVRSAAERDRAVQLARETEGVAQVVDKLTVAR